MPFDSTATDEAAAIQGARQAFSRRPHANLVKMNKAVAGWIEAAKGRMDGAAALTKRAAWVADQIAELGSERVTPAHLQGLTVFDLQSAQWALEDAAKAQAAKVAAILNQSVAA